MICLKHDAVCEMESETGMEAMRACPNSLALGATRAPRAIYATNPLVIGDDRRADAFHAPGAVDRDETPAKTGRRVIVVATMRKPPGSKSAM